LVLDGLGGGFHLIGIRHIGRHDDRRSSQRFYVTLRGLQSIHSTREQAYSRSLTRESPGGRSADACRCAGDDYYFVLSVSHVILFDLYPSLNARRRPPCAEHADEL
jgi:hypothetical protein